MLTNDQEAALNQIIFFLAQPSKLDLVLDAPAGCGKGYLLNHISKVKYEIVERVRLLNDSFQNQFHFTATTNEAVSVLPASATTIYSFAGLRPKFPAGFFETKAVNREKCIVFVDEASYIGRNAHYLIRKQLPNAKIIWVMDEFQLTDVKEKKAYVATLGFPKVTMNQVMRNQGHIQEVSLKLRDAVKHEQFIDLRQFANGNEVELLSPNAFDTKVVDVFSKSTPAKYLAYTNDCVKQYNNAIHQRVFGNPAFPHNNSRGIINKYNDKINLRCGTKVDIYDVTTKTFYLDKGTQITETYLSTNHGPLCMYDGPSSYPDYNPNKFMYSEIVLPYGCTVHKSQGQSIDTIFLDLPNINSCRDNEMIRRLKYVGWSRGINKIYLKDNYA